MIIIGSICQCNVTVRRKVASRLDGEEVNDFVIKYIMRAENYRVRSPEVYMRGVRDVNFAGDSTQPRL